MPPARCTTSVDAALETIMNGECGMSVAGTALRRHSERLPPHTLEGRTNSQGRPAAARHQPFLHVEINRTTRDDPACRAILVAALTHTYLSG